MSKKECVLCGKKDPKKTCPCCMEHYCETTPFISCDVCSEKVCQECTCWFPEDPPVCIACEDAAREYEPIPEFISDPNEEEHSEN